MQLICEETSCQWDRRMYVKRPRAVLEHYESFFTHTPLRLLRGITDPKRADCISPDERLKAQVSRATPLSKRILPYDLISSNDVRTAYLFSPMA